MYTITLYGIKTCDSVKKAQRFFKSHDIAYTFVDLRGDEFDTSRIDTWIQKISVNTLFNAKSKTYRELNIKEQKPSQDEKIALLKKHVLLIKRPVIECDDRVYVGFDLSKYERIFLK